MDLEKNKQRLEIIAAQVEELKRNGGGGGGTPTESDDFTPDNITIEDGGTFPSGSTERLTKHLPLEINDTLYYFLEETGVDYLYGSLPTSGAYPSISYFRIMKQNFAVEFHDTAIETVPTENSTNLITSGGVYTALQNAGGDLDLSPVYMGVALANNVTIPEDKRYALEKHLPITFDSADNTTRDTYVFAGSRNNSSNPYQSYYYYVNSSGQGFKTLQIDRGGYRAIFYGRISYSLLNYIDNSNIRSAMFDPTKWENRYYNGTTYPDGKVVSIPANSDFGSGNQSGFNQGCGLYRASATVAPTLLNCPTKEAFYLIIDKYAEDGSNKYGQTIVENSGARIFKRSNNGNSWTNWHLVGCDYFNPTDETLTDGGTISATALANALKHVPLSFNAHVCYYSYEDNDNVYYTSTRLNGTSLHTNVVAINKTTGVATFNEFDQS